MENMEISVFGDNKNKDKYLQLKEVEITPESMVFI